jgi:hypothetical protein
MKISIVIADGEKQIMMTPETDNEKQALKFITPNDDIEIATQWGTYDNEPSHFSYNTGKCQGGYFRRFAEKDSLMFILKEKPKSK